MPLCDLLWACPRCGADRGLANDQSACERCRTRFERGQGALIRAVAPDGAVTEASAREWLDRLPEPASLLSSNHVRTASVVVRIATETARVQGQGGYLNRVEVFGEPVTGSLRLERDRLVVSLDGRDEEPWPLETLTAVQASSGTLQLKRRGQPLVAFRFENDAVYLWEELLRAALRDFYGRTGRGAIAEFQPRIVAR